MGDRGASSFAAADGPGLGGGSGANARRAQHATRQGDPVFYTEPEEPSDPCSFYWWIFVLLGCGILVAWNAWITAVDFFQDLLGNDVEFIFSNFYNWPSLFVLFVSLKYANRFSFTSRIVTFFAVDLLVMVATPILCAPFMQSYLGDNTLLWTLSGLVCLTGIGTGVLFGGVVGMASLFPGKYVGAVMSGMGLAGILIAALRVITKAALPETTDGLQESTQLYFGLAAFVFVLCLVAYVGLIRSRFGRFYLDRANRIKVAAKVNNEQMTLLDNDFRPENVRVLAVIGKVMPTAICAFLVFFTTLLVFPGVTSYIQPEDPDFLPNGWYSILLLSTFMVGDWAGRTLPKFGVPFTAKTLFIPVILRCGLAPLFFFCIKPKYFTAWYIPFIIMFAFSISNGFCGTIAMLLGPSLVEPYERELAGVVMSFALNFGVVGGVTTSLVFAHYGSGLGSGSSSG